MMRRYDSFILRQWSVPDDQGRQIEIFHKQNNTRAVVSSLTQAVNWMQTSLLGEKRDAAQVLPLVVVGDRESIGR